MSILQSVYDRAPIPVQHLMASVSGYHKNQLRYGRVYWKYRAFLEVFDTWPLQQQLAYRDEELRRFLAYTVAHSPFYAALYEDIDLSEVRTAEDLGLLPIVDKEMLRANMEGVLAAPARGSILGRTGGTTGKSLEYRVTKSDLEKRMAQLDHFKAKHGFEHRRMRRATFMGKHIVPPGGAGPVFWRYNAASKQMLYSSFHLSEGNLGHYVDSLNRFQPEAIDGFFSAMVDLANYMERRGQRPTFRPVALFPTAETVTEPGRRLIERVFGAPVRDQYASSEGAPFITECKAGNKHIELASGVFEAKGLGTSEVLVTSFSTHGTPLIRYDIGDTVDLASHLPEACGCGARSPVVGAIGGRQTDFLYTLDGGRINAGAVANLFKAMPNSLVQAQAVQSDLGKITIKLQYDPTLRRGAHDDLLLNEFRHTFGDRMGLSIEHVDTIPRAASGKHQLIINEVQD